MIAFKAVNDWEVGEDSMKEMVRYWYSEVSSVELDHLSSYTYKSETEHFTQLAWSRTEKIGEISLSDVSSQILVLFRLRVDSVRRPGGQPPLRVTSGLQLPG